MRPKAQAYVMATLPVMLATLNDTRPTRLTLGELQRNARQGFGTLDGTGNAVAFHVRGGLWRINGTDARWLSLFLANVQRHARAEQRIKARDAADAIQVMRRFGFSHDAALARMKPQHYRAYRQHAHSLHIATRYDAHGF